MDRELKNLTLNISQLAGTLHEWHRDNPERNSIVPTRICVSVLFLPPPHRTGEHEGQTRESLAR